MSDEPRRRPGLLTEGGEPMRSPFDAQEFDVSVRQKGRQADLPLGMQSLGQALRRLTLPSMLSDAPDTEVPTEPSSERPVGCWCEGRGGRDEVPVLVFGPPEGELELRRVLYSEGHDGPTTWAMFCTCPEAEQARARKARDVEAMRLRGESQKARKLLRVTRVPQRYAGLDLSTYPDRPLAAAVERWYLGHLGEVVVEDEQESFLLLSGPNRRGKTGLAIGVLKLAMARDIDCLFRTMTSLLDELSATFDKDNPACHADILAVLKDIPLLLLDDLGANRLTEWRAETINSLLDHRSNEQKLTVITTNLGWRNPEQFDERELLTVCGERVYWRIRSSSDHVFVTGPVLGL